MKKIIEKMVLEGNHREWVLKVAKLAEKYEGLKDLMEMWYEETDEDEKIEIILDIEDTIEDIKTGVIIKGRL